MDYKFNYWYENSVFYHIYPIGFCGCDRVNKYLPVSENKLKEIQDSIPHMIDTGINAVYLGPVFQSVAHGYNTVDYKLVDTRLGTNDDFKILCKMLHDAGIKIVLDGVFNHVGRDFWAFKDVRENKWDSKYKDWFFINNGNSFYNDGFGYEGWEGHYELVKLNLYNPEVKNYIKGCITNWVNDFDIDGLRLDVAYCLDLNFLKELRGHCKQLKSDFWLMGETLHGDYNNWMNDEMLDSVTNYECYKGLYSSFNDMNMFEIAYSLNRQFGKEQWCLYTGKQLYSFVDNHDVSRIAAILTEKRHIPLIYTLLFTMPAIPSVYYGSEFCISGSKNDGDDYLRPEFNIEKFMTEGLLDLTDTICRLAQIHKNSKAICLGSYTQMQLANKQLAFLREYDGESVLVLINIDENPSSFNLNILGKYTDLITEKEYDVGNSIVVDEFSALILKKITK